MLHYIKNTYLYIETKKEMLQKNISLYRYSKGNAALYKHTYLEIPKKKCQDQSRTYQKESIAYTYTAENPTAKKISIVRFKNIKN